MNDQFSENIMTTFASSKRLLAAMLAFYGCGLLRPQALWAQEQPAMVTTIQQESPSFLVNARVNRDSRDYREGDGFSITLVSEVDAYVYVIYQQADGQAYQVFPNVGQPDNRVTAKQPVTIPREDDRFRWRIAPPFGTETVKVIASEQPLEALNDASLRSERFNAVSEAKLKNVGLQLGTEGRRLKGERNGSGTKPKIDDVPEFPDDNSFRWAETEITVTTYPRNHELETSGAKRYGVFFGVSEHRYAEQEMLITGHSPNLSSPHRDALVLNDVMDDIGDLAESRVFVNEEATRRNFELAITDWLPKKSRPGDTVFIYFSGHGGLVTDDNGDEVDQQDEFLVPHDQLGLAAVLGLAKQEEQGTLTDELKPVLASARKVVQNVDTAEKAYERLVRATGVTDDVFGHWLQALSGRHVVVILDICYSGGFAADEKGIVSGRTRRDKMPLSPIFGNRSSASTGEHATSPRANPLGASTVAGAGARTDAGGGAASRPAAQFDFLDRELTRLKDIGQDDTALLTASAGDELSLVRPDGALSVMTYELIVALRNARGPLDIEQAFALVEKQTARFFDSDEFRQLNADREEPVKPHHPRLFKPTSQQFWLKP